MIWKEAGFCNSWEVLWQNQEMGKVKTYCQCLLCGNVWV